MEKKIMVGLLGVITVCIVASTFFSLTEERWCETDGHYQHQIRNTKTAKELILVDGERGRKIFRHRYLKR